MNALPLEVSCAEVQAALASASPPVVLDCREQDEYDLVRIAAARLLPMSELAQRVAELEPFRTARLVVHCHHGGRSLRVAQWLRQQGFMQAQSMAGGIDAWAAEIDPALPRY